MKNNINTKIGATLLSAAILAGTAVIPMTNVAAAEAAKPTIKYSAHVQDHGWMAQVNEGELAGTTGESRRVEAFKFELVNCPNVTLNIKAHVQDHGDMFFTVTSADADKLVGTQWEARRIEAMTITTTGLKELGYKLQYRVHVQDYGWQDWKDEGTMAGTMYEAKRLEAVEFRMVESGEVTAKSQAIAKLEKYDVALSGAFADAPSTYTKLADQIKLTINEIKAATSDAKVNELFEAQVKSIERYLSTGKTIEDVVKEEEEDLAEEIAKINEKLAKYEEYLPKSEYTTAQKQKVYAIISETRTKISNAKIDKDIIKIDQELDALTATPDIKTDVAKYNTVLEEQKKAFEDIAVYEKLVAKLPDGNDKIMKNTAITTAKVEIAAAKKPSDSEASPAVVGDVETSLNNLKTRLGVDIVNAATAEITANQLVAAKEKAVKALQEYANCEYTDLQEIAQRLINDVNTANNLQGVTTIVATYDVDGKIATGSAVGQLVTPYGNAKTAMETYETTKASALVELNATIDAIDELKLEDANKVKAIKDMIAVYKTSIENIAVDTTTKVSAAAGEVTRLLNEFNNTYMATSHSDIAKDVQNYQFEAAKKDALLQLSKYTNSDILTVKTTATNAKNTIEGLKYASQKGTIRTTLDTALASIELDIVKNDAETLANTLIAELSEYKNYDPKYNVSSLASIAINNINVELYTIKDMSVLNDTNQKTIDTCIYNMKDIKNKALENILKNINANSSIIAEEVTAAKKLATEEIDRYINVATSLEDSNLINELYTYRSLVSSATSKAAVDAIVDFADATVTIKDVADSKTEGTVTIKNVKTSCSLYTLVNTSTNSKYVYDRVNTIKEIEARYNFECYTMKDGAFTTTVKNKDLLADTELQTAISTAINNIKAKTTTTQVQISGYLGDKDGGVIKTINDKKSEYANLTAAKNAALAKINVTGNSVTVQAFKATLEKEVLQTYINTINNVTLKQFTEYTGAADTNIFTATVNDAVAKVKTYIEDNMKADARARIDAKRQAADQTKLDPAKTADAFITANASDLTLTGATTDDLIKAAKTASGKIDTAIEDYVVVK